MFYFENKYVTRTLESKEQLNKTIFGNGFYLQNIYNIRGLKKSDFYNDNGTIIPGVDVRVNTNVPFTVLQLQTIRSACTVVKEKCSKQELGSQKTCAIREYLLRYKKGSGHIRKIMCPNIDIGVSQNINKYSEKMDVIVNVQQSKFLNKSWNNNIFTNAEKTFFFKLHSNILGYNSMVAHFVRGHSPNCNFCDINETAWNILKPRCIYSLIVILLATSLIQ